MSGFSFQNAAPVEAQEKGNRIDPITNVNAKAGAIETSVPLAGLEQHLGNIEALRGYFGQGTDRKTGKPNGNSTMAYGKTTLDFGDEVDYVVQVQTTVYAMPKKRD